MVQNLNAVVRPAEKIPPNAQTIKLALFNEDGSPFALGDGSGSSSGGISEKQVQDALELKADKDEFSSALAELGPAPTSGTYQIVSIDGELTWSEVE